MITARVSSKGQIAIPKPIREQFRLGRGTEVTVSIEGDSLVLKKVPPDDWKRWEGAFAGLDLTGERARERAGELKRDAARTRR